MVSGACAVLSSLVCKSAGPRRYVSDIVSAKSRARAKEAREQRRHPHSNGGQTHHPERTHSHTTPRAASPSSATCKCPSVSSVALLARTLYCYCTLRTRDCFPAWCLSPGGISRDERSAPLRGPPCQGLHGAQAARATVGGRSCTPRSFWRTVDEARAGSLICLGSEVRKPHLTATSCDCICALRRIDASLDVPAAGDAAAIPPAKTSADAGAEAPAPATQHVDSQTHATDDTDGSTNNKTPGPGEDTRPARLVSAY